MQKEDTPNINLVKAKMPYKNNKMKHAYLS